MNTGVGSEIERLVSWFIQPTRKCPGCVEARKIIDTWPVGICEAKIDQILNMMQDNAKSLGIPFSRLIYRQVILRAIANVKKRNS